MAETLKIGKLFHWLRIFVIEYRNSPCDSELYDTPSLLEARAEPICDRICYFYFYKISLYSSASIPAVG